MKHKIFYKYHYTVQVKKNHRLSSKPQVHKHTRFRINNNNMSQVLMHATRVSGAAMHVANDRDNQKRLIQNTG